MNDPMKLQQRLLEILKGTPALKVFPPSEQGWSPQEFEEVASIVQSFVNNNESVVEDQDPLRDWMERYMFHRTTLKLR